MGVDVEGREGGSEDGEDEGKETMEGGAVEERVVAVEKTQEQKH